MGLTAHLSGACCVLRSLLSSPLRRAWPALDGRRGCPRERNQRVPQLSDSRFNSALRACLALRQSHCERHVGEATALPRARDSHGTMASSAEAPSATAPPPAVPASAAPDAGPVAPGAPCSRTPKPKPASRNGKGAQPQLKLGPLEAVATNLLSAALGGLIMGVVRGVRGKQRRLAAAQRESFHPLRSWLTGSAAAKQLCTLRSSKPSCQAACCGEPG